MTSAPATGNGLRLFGDVRVDGKPLPGRRAKALLLALALARGRPVSATTLIDEVWGQDAPANAATALHTMVSRIRAGHSHQLIVSSDAGYAVGLPAGAIDYWAARELQDAARTALPHDPKSCLDLIARASGLADGEPAPGTAASPARDDFIARAMTLRQGIDRTFAEALLATGAPKAAVDLLQPHLAADPLDEPLHGLYFRALSADGQANAALAGYDLLSRRLRQELGTGPSPTLQQLQARLLQETDDAVSHLGTATPPPAMRAVARNSSVVQYAPAADGSQALEDNEPSEDGPAMTGSPVIAGSTAGEFSRPAYTFGLRAAPNELVGRAGDLAAVEKLMANGRFTTILGVGGLGKTRMAMEVANRVAAAGQSVILVELAGVRNPEDIWLALAEGAGIREARSNRSLQEARPVHDLHGSTMASLKAAPVLLVVDNCEHLVRRAAAVIAEILAACPNAAVLATSRAPLSIGGESIYQLQPLSTAHTSADPAGTALPPAVELFNKRALAARASARLDPSVVRGLCEHLDGLPLAIELAAARVRLMSVEEIAQRLAVNMDVLINTDRSAPERHRTLTAVINWSWDLLSDTERTVMRRLSRFHGGFSLDAACATAACLPLGPLPVGELPVGEPSDDGQQPDSDAGAPAQQLSQYAVESAVEALVNQSLVLPGEDPSTGGVRFRMLETVREHAMAKLDAAGETDAVETALTGWAEKFAIVALADSTGPKQLAAIARVTVEQDNLLHALRSAMASGGPDNASKVFAIFGMLASYWSQRGMHTEVYEFAQSIPAATRDYVPNARTVNAAAFGLSALAVTAMVFDVRQGVVARSRLRRIVAAQLPLSPRINAMAQVVLAVGNEVKVMALLAKLRADPRDDVAATALLLSCTWAENQAEPEKAIGYAEKSFRLSEKLQDTWSAGSAADNAAQLYSQGARPELAVKWARLAAERMSLVGATPDVGSATLTLALNLAALGRPDAAEEALRALRALDAGESRQESAALETMAAAEIAFARGNAAEGLRLYRSIPLRQRQERTRGPLEQIVRSARICAELLYNPDPGHSDAASREVAWLRRSVLAGQRRSPGFQDLPVLGTLGLAVGGWHARLADPGTRRADVGLELLVLAGVLKGRQDERVLVRIRHEAAARDRHGAAAFNAVAAAVAANFHDPTRAVARVLELFTDPALRES